MKRGIGKFFTVILSMALVYSLLCTNAIKVQAEEIFQYFTFIKQQDNNIEDSIQNAAYNLNMLQNETESTTAQNLDTAQVQIEEAKSYTYNGKEIKPEVEVSMEQQTLAENTDYEVSYEDNKNAGIAVVKVVGKGTYTGSVEKNFTIAPKSINDADVSVNDSNLKTNLEFNGKDRTPIVELKYNGQNLNTMADFTVKYANNFWPGTAKITIKGIGNYTGSITKSFSIVKMPIQDVTIRTTFDEYKRLLITVNNGSYAMTKDTDYSYTVVADNQGNITITFKGLGNNYTGTYVRKILAEDNPNWPIQVNAPASAIRAGTSIVNNLVTLNYSVEMPVIKVKAVSIKKIKNSKGKKVSLTWKKISKASGYKIRYSTSKKFKNAKTKTIKKNITKYTIMKLKLKRKYYFQIRAYRVYYDNTYYGDWSKLKKIKVTK